MTVTGTNNRFNEVSPELDSKALSTNLPNPCPSEVEHTGTHAADYGAKKWQRELDHEIIFGTSLMQSSYEVYVVAPQLLGHGVGDPRTYLNSTGLPGGLQPVIPDAYRDTSL